jgi:predicted DNA-binding transcriptional regulator YafY
MEKRKPTYGSAIRMTELVLKLSKSWRPIPVNQICEYFSISLRTAQRYRKALNENIATEEGEEFIRVIKEGGIEKWYLANQEDIMTATYFRITSVYVAMALIKSLESTVLENGLKYVWEMVTGHLKPSVKASLDHLNRKFRYSGFGRKSYAKKSEVLTDILKSIIHQKKLQILHYSHNVHRNKYHIIHPYTLLLHRDSLYLNAYVEGYEQIRTFLIDRIEEVVYINEPFKYPSNYDPDIITDGSFGIYQGANDKSSKITLQFKEILREYITTRFWHPTQKFSQIKNGTFTMDIELNNTNEFMPWILQFGSDAKVLKPKSLRDKIKKELLTAYETYHPK